MHVVKKRSVLLIKESVESKPGQSNRERRGEGMEKGEGEGRGDGRWEWCKQLKGSLTSI